MANREYMFPFASVVKVTRDQIPSALGQSLVVTAITHDDDLIRDLVTIAKRRSLEHRRRTNKSNQLGPTARGQLFEHLYARRAFKRAVA
jgi:hypothetical protein